MNRARTVSATMRAPAHGGVEKNCVTMTETAIHTVTLPEGNFVAVVLSRPTSEVGAISIMDRAEVEAHILLLRNALEDAERLDAGKPTRHAAPSLVRN